jgi:hypothetical protein
MCDMETQSPHSHYSNFSKKVQHVGMGTTIGDTTLLTGVKQASISVKAHTTVLGYQLHHHRMRELLSTQPTLLANLWKHAAVHLAWPILTELPMYKDLDEQEVSDKLAKWKLFKLKAVRGSGGEVWGEWSGGKGGRELLESIDAGKASINAGGPNVQVQC